MPNLTTTEAAAMLTARNIRIHSKPVTSKTVAHWCRLGVLPATHFAGRWSIDSSVLETFQPPALGFQPLPPLQLDTTPVAGVCRVVGCDGKSRVLGVCQKHYRRLYRAGMLDSLKGLK